MLLYNVRYYTRNWVALRGVGSLESNVELRDLDMDERAVARCSNGYEPEEHWDGTRWVTGLPYPLKMQAGELR